MSSVPITLQQVTSSSSLYTGSGLAFYLWGQPSPPSTLPLAETWATAGPPAQPGYYLFLTTPPTPANAAALETNLAAALQAPVASSCVWANDDGPRLRNLAVLSIAAAANASPVVASSVSFALPPGVPTVGFAAQTPVSAITGAGGDPLVLVFGTPPIPLMPAAATGGVFLPLIGQLSGCLTFSGLMSVPPQTTNKSAVKQWVKMQLDPLNVFGPRTRGTFAGRTIVLSQGKAGYRFFR